MTLFLLAILLQGPGDGSASKRPAAEKEVTKTDAAKPEPAKKAPKVKVYTFGALDVEGKLRTPQLLYFLNRVKLELDTSAPSRRSFMKELERTADDKDL